MMRSICQTINVMVVQNVISSSMSYFVIELQNDDISDEILGKINLLRNALFMSESRVRAPCRAAIFNFPILPCNYARVFLRILVLIVK